MAAAGMGSQFQHICQHGDGPPFPLVLYYISQGLEGCFHRSWTGIVGIVDYRHRSEMEDFLAHAGHLQVFQPLGDGFVRDAVHFPHCHRSQGVHYIVPT